MIRLGKVFDKIEALWKDENFRIRVAEYFYLSLFSIYMFYFFSKTTMFIIEWPLNFIYILRIFLGVFVFFKYTVEKCPDFKVTILISGILLSFLMSWKNTGYYQLIDAVFLMLGAKGIYYKKIAKVYLFISIPFTVYTVFASQMGIVTNLIYNQGGRIRESFGFVYPTDFAARIFFIIVGWILIRQVKCTFIELGMMVLSVVFLDIKSDTRCSEITILLIVGCITYLKIRNYMASKNNKKYKASLLLKISCISSPFIFAPIMILLSRFYNPDNSFLLELNKILTGRLKLGKKTFDNYDTKLLGQYIEMKGNGGTLEKPIDYTFIDCSYTNILMRFGLIVFIFVLIIIEIIMIKNLNNIYILGLVMLVCLHSVIEHHLFEFYYNIFMILPFASFEDTIKKKKILKKFKVMNI